MKKKQLREYYGNELLAETETWLIGKMQKQFLNFKGC